MKQITSKEKLQQNKSLTDNRLSVALKDLIHPVLNILTKIVVPCNTIIKKPCNIIDDKPVIYVINHSSFKDTPIICREIYKRGYILAGKQNLGFSDWLFFILNGVIWVDRKDKEDMSASKKAMVEYLKINQHIIMFPESTWNLTDNLMMLPMKWGVVDIAREADAQIIPVVLEYENNNKKCFIDFGEPIIFDSNSRKSAAISMLRDTMSTMRWEFWEEKGIASRRDMDVAEEYIKLHYSVQEFNPNDWEYELSCIFRPYTDCKEAFDHLDLLVPCQKNAFLFKKN